ncbi:MAG: hypothetical protein KME46_30180 [Brasilonema angustatum HA4187-MV1]|jgi:hypothetical protein|nr:hypothetical protein [Brasilonema angustatum HA4187-MV1]
MDNLESKIIDVLKHGTPLRAIQIANKLGVERREINHYLYSSLKHLVVQDSDYRWLLKTNQISNTQRPPTQASTSHTKSSQPARQNNLYSFTKQEIKQDSPIQPPTSKTSSSQPIKHENLQKFHEKYFKQNSKLQQSSTPQSPSSEPVRKTNPSEFIKKELAQASPEEKVKILENVFRQEQFRELEDEEINALQSILEQSRREIDIANTAYTQGKLSTRKNNPIVIAALSIALTLATLFLISQFLPKLTNQTVPTLPQSQ